MFNVQINGRKKWFTTLDAAIAYANKVFIRTWVVLGIEKE